MAGHMAPDELAWMLIQAPEPRPPQLLPTLRNWVNGLRAGTTEVMEGIFEITRQQLSALGCEEFAAIRGKPLRRPPRPPKALKQANQALEEAKFALVVRSAMLVLLLNVREKEKRESAVPRVQNEAFGVQAKYFDRLLAGAMLAAEQMYDAKLAVLQANWTAPMDEVAEEKQQLAAEKQRGQAAATECLAFLLGALVSLVVFFFICCSVFFFLRFCYLVVVRVFGLQQGQGQQGQQA